MVIQVPLVYFLHPELILQEFYKNPQPLQSEPARLFQTDVGELNL